MLHWLLALGAVAVSAEKQCLLDLYSSQQGGSTCVKDTDQLCTRHDMAILVYTDAEEEERAMPFDGTTGGYDELVNRMLTVGAVPDTNYLANNVTLQCGYDGNSLRVFDDESLDACFALTKITMRESEDPVTYLGLDQVVGGSCMRYPAEAEVGDAVALAVATAVGSIKRDISFDQNANGYISDGGVDMYDNGNYYTTNLCSNHAAGSRIYPWVVDWTPTATTCFGAGSSYQIRQANGVMVFFAQNEADVPVNFWITGWKGSGAESQHGDMEEYEYKGLRGYSMCYPENGQNSSLQKMVLTRKKSDLAVQVGWASHCVPSGKTGLPYGASSDCVNMFIDDITPGYSVAVVLWSENRANSCEENNHQAMFEAVAGAFGC